MIKQTRGLEKWQVSPWAGQFILYQLVTEWVVFELVLGGCTGLGKEWGEEIRIRGNGGSRDRDKGACLLGRWEQGKTTV